MKTVSISRFGDRIDRARAKLRRVPRSVWLALLVVSLLPLLLDPFIRYPVSGSSPPGLYLLTYQPIRRGSWVAVCLPDRIAQLGRRRGYLEAGRCGNASEVLKHVVALPGDVVRVTDRGLSINGVALPGSARLDRDSAGRLVPSIPPGVYPVAPGMVWLVSTYNPKSWDSRYYGPVPLVGVRSSARLLWAAPGYEN